MPGANNDAGSAPNSWVQEKWVTWKPRLVKNFLVIGFTAVFAVSLLWPQPGRAVSTWKKGDFGVVISINIVVIFVLSGLILKTEEVKAALHCWRAILFGALSVLLISPSLAFGLIHFPLQPNEFQLGLALASMVPSTLAQGQTLTAQAGGNQALALILLMVGQAGAIFTVPYGLKLLIKANGDVHIDPPPLLLKLFLIVLLPCAVGKAIREVGLPWYSSKRLQAWLVHHKVALMFANLSNLLCIMWQQLSSAQQAITDQRFVNLLAAFGAAIVLQCALVGINYLGVRVLMLPSKEAVAVLIMGFQKSMPFLVTVLAFLPKTLGVPGLILTPPICGQVLQLFIGAFISSKYADIIKQEKQREIEETSSAALPATPANAGVEMRSELRAENQV